MCREQPAISCPSLIGAALLVFAIGLSQRVALAWGGTVGLLLIAAAYTAAQRDPIWIPAVLVLSAVLVAPFRDAFYRHARLLTSTLKTDVLVPLLALAACVLALASFEPATRRPAENSWWELVLSPDLPNGLRVVMALAVLLGLLALWRLLRPGHVTCLPWAGEGRLRYAALGADPPATADGLVMGEAGRAGIPFRRLGRVMLGIGDRPPEPPRTGISAIWRLREPGAAGRSRPGGLARRSHAAESLWRPSASPRSRSPATARCWWKARRSPSPPHTIYAASSPSGTW